MRKFLCVAATLGTMMTGIGTVEAQSYPEGPVSIVVGYSAGGFADTVTRIIAERMSASLGQPVVVENQPGAASNVAALAVSRVNADGYTILATTTSVAINQTLYGSLEYGMDDLIPVAVPVAAPEVLAVHPEFPAQSLAEFLSYAGENTVTYATAGVGSGSHIAAGYFFSELAGVNAIHVPFGGGAPAVGAVLGQQVGATAITIPAIAPQFQSGGLNCLAVAAPERTPIAPDCPTYSESGFDHFVAQSWVGFFVPVGTDPEIVARLNTAVNEAIADPEAAERLAALGNTIQTLDPAETAKFVSSEVSSWSERVQALELRID
ncbi:tripartite tricarboxylate transporter substrate binding protein (plasmid) [Roseibium aggregatum]|uniref:Bug family tripartite tricarboxylate transporter substrate binding protein n=1 Tax=Roseibium aggregatum TaxID=187304 RepID=UPI001E46D20A|nr:tripartite tricarboxylate transporter substrate binding protein [Roseibium aggregatum]UES60056.1 tripartite tricarboxylate transporter substrate binding protein [Roseibium aggregatum]